MFEEGEMTKNPPAFNSASFDCPHCGAFTQQDWRNIQHTDKNNIGAMQKSEVFLAYCLASNCKKYSVWLFEWAHTRLGGSDLSEGGGHVVDTRRPIMLFPKENLLPMPLPETPEDVKIDYEEARSIAQDSPRAAMALLRLALQKLMIHFGFPGNNLNEDIKKLISDKGLNPKLQQILHGIRVFGNNAVHPPHSDLTIVYTTEEVAKFFGVFNQIIQEIIVNPKLVDDLMSGLPPNAMPPIV